VDLYEVLDQVVALVRQRKRITYRLIQRQFALDEATLEDLKAELFFAYPQIADADGHSLIWTGEADVTSAPAPTPAHAAPPVPQRPQRVASPMPPQMAEAERRQLTVLFCDLVDSTALSGQLDPEDFREVVRAYQDTCAKVIARFDGHIAQLLGDGLLVYFGYPLAHEDDAQRAVRAGLGMLDSLGQLNTRLGEERGVQLAVRLGVHTGLVVVGEVGGGTRQEQLALGETPNLAARLQGLAAPNTLVISATTFQLLGGFFACQPLGTPPLKGQTQPLAVYRVLYESMARSRLEAVGSAGWTPLVGREQEIGLLRERWAQVKDGLGQVVLLSGEAGIGKSRLVQVLKEHVAAEPQAWLTPCQCSPYYQHTALYPLIELLERVALRFEREESPPQKLRKLEGFVVQYGLPLAETVPLLAALLSLPLPADYAPLTLSPEQQKHMTLHALLTILLRIAVQQPVLFVMEDLHWVDPTTLELLSLLVDQGPTARILALWTFRPDFSPPWTGRAHLTQVTLPRLPQRQAAEIAARVAHGKVLPPEIVAQVVAKTDGVPLFVEELTKMVLESGLLQEREAHYELSGPLPPLAIPATLHDSLMARLDRLAAVKGLAQFGATLGREFSYALLQAVSPWDEGTLQRGLQQLVAAEFLYQQGLPPQATYVFKHVLIQDAAYQSLLRSTRQQYHQRIAQVLEAQFLEIAEAQPELLAHHCTAAGLPAQALPYWQRAGQRASERSAHVEAIAHLRQGLALLQTLPETPERTRREVDMLSALGASLIATQGYGAPEVAQTYLRARQLCAHLDDPHQRFPVLRGLWLYYLACADLQTTHDLSKQLLSVARHVQDAAMLVVAYRVLGATLLQRGAVAEAHAHFTQGIALYDPQHHHALAVLYGEDAGVICHSLDAWMLWCLGYPDQGKVHNEEAVTLAQQSAHPFSLSCILGFAAIFHQYRREVRTAQERAAAAIRLAKEQGFPFWLAHGAILHGWALAQQGQAQEGIAQLTEGLMTYRATGAENLRPYWLALLAEAHGMQGEPEAGLAVLAEALTVVDKTGGRSYEPEMYRLKGALLLQQHADNEAEAETCFHHAIRIAQSQQATSWELRAVTSLARLWQQQGKRQAAHDLLVPVYHWFTEGFDTPDLQQARALLHALS
jgi:class 3 adenylate cyclase/predicted ATPase